MEATEKTYPGLTLIDTGKVITLDRLRIFSTDWNGRSVDLLVKTQGSGNMFGGDGKMVHICLHGENSVQETGLMEIKGFAIHSSNIARGGNGASSQHVKYWKTKDLMIRTHECAADYEINISGSCGGGEAALAQILSAKIDTLKSDWEL